MFCILLSDQFLVCEEKRKNKDVVSYQVKDVVSLNSATEIHDHPTKASDGQCQYVFRLRGSAKITLVASSEKEKEEWSSAIVQAIIKNAENESSTIFFHEWG